jgi:enoyl-[acyl-carrier protein] reductase II
MKNRICTLFQIEKPIIQAGMIWCSGWELAAAVSEAGGLGLIGAGSMYPEILREQIRKCKQATSKPFGVNIPLLYPDIDKHIQVLIDEGVKIVFTSAGNPKTWTTHLKEKGMTVVHVVSGLRFAVKCQEAGVDAIVAEGFEAGGHNGREETTTLVLIPAIRKAINIPLIAAGGIGSGEQMAAAFALGAEAVQIGSRFVASFESSAHENFKKAVVQAAEGDTSLRLKQLTPVRLLRNKFSNEVAEAEKRGAGAEELSNLLGRARAKKGMFEGDLEEGELEIGQVSANIQEIKPAREIVEEIYQQFKMTLEELKQTLSNF